MSILKNEQENINNYFLPHKLLHIIHNIYILYTYICVSPHMHTHKEYKLNPSKIYQKGSHSFIRIKYGEKVVFYIFLYYCILQHKN